VLSTSPISRWFSKFFTRRPSLDPWKSGPKPTKAPKSTTTRLRTIDDNEPASRQRSNSLPSKHELVIPKPSKQQPNNNKNETTTTKARQSSLLILAQEHLRKNQLGSQPSPSFQPTILPSTLSPKYAIQQSNGIESSTTDKNSISGPISISGVTTFPTPSSDLTKHRDSEVSTTNHEDA